MLGTTSFWLEFDSSSPSLPPANSAGEFAKAKVEWNAT